MQWMQDLLTFSGTCNSQQSGTHSPLLIAAYFSGSRTILNVPF